MATKADLTVRCAGPDASAIAQSIAHAADNCTVANSLRGGLPVDIRSVV